MTINELKSDTRSGIICSDRFGATKITDNPRLIVWFGVRARILTIGQAHGLPTFEALA